MTEKTGNQDLNNLNKKDNNEEELQFTFDFDLEKPVEEDAKLVNEVKEVKKESNEIKDSDTLSFELEESIKEEAPETLPVLRKDADLNTPTPTFVLEDPKTDDIQDIPEPTQFMIEEPTPLPAAIPVSTPTPIDNVDNTYLVNPSLESVSTTSSTSTAPELLVHPTQSTPVAQSIAPNIAPIAPYTPTPAIEDSVEYNSKIEDVEKAEAEIEETENTQIPPTPPTPPIVPPFIPNNNSTPPPAKPKGSKTTVIAAAVGVVVLLAIGGAAYKVHDNMEERRASMEANMVKLQASLPPGVGLTNTVISQGLFSTEGNYILSFDKGAKASNLETHYTVEHGVGSWFGGDIQFKGDTKITGQGAKLFRQNADKLAHTEGTFKENGSYNLVSTTSELVLQDTDKSKVREEGQAEAFIKIMPSTSKIDYSAPNGEVKSSFAFPRIEFIKSDDNKVVFDKTSDVALVSTVFTRNFNIAQPQLGDFLLTVDSAGNDVFGLNKILLNSSVVLKQAKYNIKTVMKVGEVKSPIAQAHQLEFTTSLNGLDAASTQKFTTVYNDYMRTRELSDKQVIMLREAFMGLASKGFVLSLDKAQGYMDAQKTNGGELSLKMELKPSVIESEVSFSEKTKISASLNVNGPQAATANLMLNSLFSQELVARSSQQFGMVAEYDNKILTVNHRANLSGIDAQIYNYLKMADKALGLYYKEEDALSSGSEAVNEAMRAAQEAHGLTSTEQQEQATQAEETDTTEEVETPATK